MSETISLLEARGMSIWRGEHLLVDELDVVVNSGQVVQIQGSNGSGKTTLLRALIGLSEFDEGQVLWCGKPVHTVRDDMHNSLVYLGHKAGITGGLTPFENLMALCPELSAQTVDLLDARKRVSSALAQLQVESRMDLPSEALSAGQKRRVSLARLVLQRARLWVLDEPLTSLDSEGQQWVKTKIQEHVNEGGSVLFTTHQSLLFEQCAVNTLVLATQD